MSFSQRFALEYPTTSLTDFEKQETLPLSGYPNFKAFTNTANLPDAKKQKFTACTIFRESDGSSPRSLPLTSVSEDEYTELPLLETRPSPLAKFDGFLSDDSGTSSRFNQDSMLPVPFPHPSLPRVSTPRSHTSLEEEALSKNTLVVESSASVVETPKSIAYINDGLKMSPSSRVYEDDFFKPFTDDDVEEVDDDEITGLLSRQAVRSTAYWDGWNALTNANSDDELENYVAEERISGMETIKHQATQVLSVFKEINNMILNQQENIDSLDHSMLNIKATTKNAVDELKRANATKQQARKRKLFFIFMTLFFGLIVIGLYSTQVSSSSTPTPNSLVYGAGQ